jgi:hypothetical protein
MRYLFLAIFYLATMFSCSRKEDKYKKFVEQYKDENFEVFKNTSMFIRGAASDGGEIVFAYDEPISSTLNNGAYVITIDDTRKKIKNTSCHLMKDSTVVDKKKLERLVIKFIEYPISYLGVDSSNNVFINLKINESPDLIRFSDLKYKTEKYKNWKQIKGNWYEKKE